jgi:hypothetical protein
MGQSSRRTRLPAASVPRVALGSPIGNASHDEPGKRTLGAAETFDGKTLAAAATDGDGSTRAVVPDSPGSEPVDPTVPAVFPGGVTLAPSDPGGFILQVNGPNSAEGPSLREIHEGPEMGRTVAATPSPDPSVLSQETSDGDAPPAPRARPVPVIDGYEILGELGRGGMGIVYRAREVLLNRPCALKMILADAHADVLTAHRFLAEAEAVARLQHPNIVQIHRIGEAHGLPYFELEYVDGGSLDQKLDGTPWPARRPAWRSTR